MGGEEGEGMNRWKRRRGRGWLDGRGGGGKESEVRSIKSVSQTGAPVVFYCTHIISENNIGKDNTEQRLENTTTFFLSTKTSWIFLTNSLNRLGCRAQLRIRHYSMWFNEAARFIVKYRIILKWKVCCFSNHFADQFKFIVASKMFFFPSHTGRVDEVILQ